MTQPIIPRLGSHVWQDVDTCDMTRAAGSDTCDWGTSRVLRTNPTQCQENFPDPPPSPPSPSSSSSSETETEVDVLEEVADFPEEEADLAVFVMPSEEEQDAQPEEIFEHEEDPELQTEDEVDEEDGEIVRERDFRWMCVNIIDRCPLSDLNLVQAAMLDEFFQEREVMNEADDPNTMLTMHGISQERMSTAGIMSGLMNCKVSEMDWAQRRAVTWWLIERGYIATAFTMA